MAGSNRPTNSMGQIFNDFKRGPAIVLTWFLALGGVALLFNHKAQRYEYIGLARGLEYKVSPEVIGKIETVGVDICDDVEAGQVVARLDQSLSGAQIETARAGITELEAQLKAEMAKLAQDKQQRVTDWQSQFADLQTREEQYGVNALNLKVTLESDRIDEQRLSLEMERAKKLLAQRAFAQQDYDSLRLKHEEIVKRIEENTRVAAQLAKNSREARGRREKFLTEKPEARAEEAQLAPLREAIHKQELAIDELQLMRERSVLRAPVSGRVTQVLCRLGQAVTPGEPIVVIAEKNAIQIVGYFDESETREVAEKMRVEIARVNKPLTVAEAIVERVGNGVEPLPDRLWRDARRPEFGRSFLVSAAAPLGLIPGEKVMIRFIN